MLKVKAEKERNPGCCNVERFSGTNRPLSTCWFDCVGAVAGCKKGVKSHSNHHQVKKNIKVGTCLYLSDHNVIIQIHTHLFIYFLKPHTREHVATAEIINLNWDIWWLINHKERKCNKKIKLNNTNNPHKI